MTQPPADVTVGFSTRLLPVTHWEESLAGRPGVCLVEMDLSSEERIRQAARHAGCLIVGTIEPLNRAVLEALPNLRLIVRRGAGVDNVDLDAARDLGIAVSTVPDASVEEVSDHALALLLSVERRIATLDRAVRAGAGAGARTIPDGARRFADMTLGVVGLGRIGARLVEKARGIFARVLGHDPIVREVDGVEMVSLDDLVATADAISVHVPLTEATRGLFDHRLFGVMKQGAILVNASRGEVVDEQALASALASGRLAGAGLDVVADEPMRADNPLLAHDNVVATGHTGGRGRMASDELHRRSVAAAEAFVEGGVPENLIDPGAWPPRGTGP